ncbi:MAG: MOFRL family protein, partial [Planctomycetota bacterium]
PCPSPQPLTPAYHSAENVHSAAGERGRGEGPAGRGEGHDWVTPTGCLVRNLVIGNNAVAVAAAAQEARRLGYLVTAHSATELEGSAEEVGQALAQQLRVMCASGQRAVAISGGEPVVRLVPAAERGRGGRNQQLVLAAAADLHRPLQRHDQASDSGETPLSGPGWVLLSGGTDGEDGPTDAAGAWIDVATLAAAQQLGLRPTEYLRRNDAYHFFEPLGALIKTGPTHTNVCDLRILVFC